MLCNRNTLTYLHLDSPWQIHAIQSSRGGLFNADYTTDRLEWHWSVCLSRHQWTRENSIQAHLRHYAGPSWYQHFQFNYRYVCTSLYNKTTKFALTVALHQYSGTSLKGHLWNKDTLLIRTLDWVPTLSYYFPLDGSLIRTIIFGSTGVHIGEVPQ